MPFCFCWANENWTRRWDGNEDDILLKQTYSAEDARAFIRYLIPFFRDARHITIDGRPLLFVYRPTNIPDIGEYLDAWAAECEAAGLRKPFVAAVLTRGAVNPDDFGMDAGVERVLHDWTAGNVEDIARRACSVPLSGRCEGSALSRGGEILSTFGRAKAVHVFSVARSQLGQFRSLWGGRISAARKHAAAFSGMAGRRDCNIPRQRCRRTGSSF